MSRLIILCIFFVGCVTAPVTDDIDKELAEESELYIADEEAEEPELEEEEYELEEEEPELEEEEYEHIPADEVDEEPLEEEVVAEPEPEMDGPIAGRFETLTRDCVVRDKPRGKRMHVLRAGKRLWVEEPDPGVGWYRVYTRKSLAYMGEVCFR